MDKNNIILTNQSGFRKARQTKDNIFFITQKSQQAFNEDKKTLAVFFDIAGAFDKVWHSGLIYKLAIMKVPYYLLKIIMNFLEDRSFSVKLEGTLSSRRLIKCGVPHGGVFSPTLFSCYINDVPLAEGANEKCLLFADDIVFTLSFFYKKKNRISKEASDEAKNKCQVYLNKLEQWMNTWHLSLAPHKCSQITFSRSNDSEHDELDIKLYNQRIPYDSSPKFLGKTFDKRLNFEKHNEKIAEKVKDRINILKVLSYDKHWGLNSKFLINIYKILVLSVMDYSSVITSASSKKVLMDLEVLQNDALRVIFKKTLMDKITVDQLREWGKIDSVEARHEKLMSDYYEKALLSKNPLLEELFFNYKLFKRRNLIREGLSIKQDGTVDLETLDLIKRTNLNFLAQEKHKTIICSAQGFIKNFLIDIGELGSIGMAIR